jgi:hypothetical protein
VLVTNNNGPVRLLLNQTSPQRPSLTIRTGQPKGDRFAAGASIGVEREGRPTLWRRVRTDGSYLSASDTRVHVGLGDHPKISGVVVHWPSGDREQFSVPESVKSITLQRGAGKRLQ